MEYINSNNQIEEILNSDYSPDVKRIMLEGLKKVYMLECNCPGYVGLEEFASSNELQVSSR